MVVIFKSAVAVLTILRPARIVVRMNVTTGSSIISSFADNDFGVVKAVSAAVAARSGGIPS
jgi:hypothetical protein